MRLGKIQREILEWCLWMGHVDRQYIYETKYPIHLKMIAEDYKDKDKYINQIRVSISQTLKTLKDRDLITERTGLIFLTLRGRHTIQERNRKELGFTSTKYDKKLKVKK